MKCIFPLICIFNCSQLHAVIHSSWITRDQLNKQICQFWIDHENVLKNILFCVSSFCNLLVSHRSTWMFAWMEHLFRSCIALKMKLNSDQAESYYWFQSQIRSSDSCQSVLDNAYDMSSLTHFKMEIEAGSKGIPVSSIKYQQALRKYCRLQRMSGTEFSRCVIGSVMTVQSIINWSNLLTVLLQADVCHAYQLLRSLGIPAENIITFMYDDIANNPQ